MPSRPTHKELTGKLRQALALLNSSGYFPVDPIKVSEDFTSLYLFSEEEQRLGIEKALQEIDPTLYRGGSPPLRSFEDAVHGSEIFVFIWRSLYFERQMYLKFCLHPSDNKEMDLYLLSLHEDRPEKKRKRE